jgi:hypothetical protein
MPNNTKTMHAPKVGLDNVPNKVHWGVFMPLLQNWFLIALGSWKGFICKLFAYSLEFLTISYTFYWK